MTFRTPRSREASHSDWTHKDAFPTIHIEHITQAETAKETFSTQAPSTPAPVPAPASAPAAKTHALTLKQLACLVEHAHTRLASLQLELRRIERNNNAFKMKQLVEQVVSDAVFDATQVAYVDRKARVERLCAEWEARIEADEEMLRLRMEEEIGEEKEQRGRRR